MKMKRLVFVTAIALVLGLAPGAHATLTGYDNGLFVYDSTTNLTWYDPVPTALMTWGQAVSWAQSLSVTVNGTTVTGWTLPTSDTCVGLNCTGSEMGHLYYDDLGNTPASGLANEGPFANLYPDFYWSGTEYAPDSLEAWYMDFDTGFQAANDKGVDELALAVISGNVAAPVPEPVSLFLFGAGLVGMAVIGRKNRKEEI